MLILFDTSNIYYLPQFMPIVRLLLVREHTVKLVCYRNNIKPEFESVISDSGVDFEWVEDAKGASCLYAQLQADWIFFANEYRYIPQLPVMTRTVQLGHGVGPKPSYYHKSSTPMTVRFMEGCERLVKIKLLYPDDVFVQVGYPKLDPVISGDEKGVDVSDLGLDPAKKTVLYAPTFNPSSLECFPDDWPNLFLDYNILIKPHTFTYTIDAYKKQRSKLSKWSRFNNVFVAGEDELSIVPYMKTADILLSEASSTLFEFAALDKPVIVCNFFKLKWTYRGPFKYRFEKRFGKDNVLYEGIGLHVNRFSELLKAIPQQLGSPDEYQANRAQFTSDHVGPMDGRASARIVEYIEHYNRDEA